MGEKIVPWNSMGQLLVLHAYTSQVTDFFFFLRKKINLTSNYSLEYDFIVTNTGCYYKLKKAL